MNAPRPRTLALEALLVFGFALALRLPQITQEAALDELYHVLAARQWLVDGTLSIHGGEPYDRVASFTLLVAGLFRIFGESLVVARLPALITGCALPALVFVWLRVYGLRGAAWLAGVLVALEPELVRLSQMIRFYGPQQLLFALGAIGAFVASDRERARTTRLAALACAALALWGAQEMHVVSRIGIGAIALFLALVALPDAVRWLRAHRGVRIAAAAGIVVAVALGALAYERGWHETYLQLATYVDLWASENAEHWIYYHQMLEAEYPVLWPLFPAAVLVALSAAPRVALLSVCVFGLALAAQSFMAFKAPRFVSYAFPFFLAVWAVALARLAPALVRLTERTALAIRPQLAPPHVVHAASLLAVGLAAAFVALNTNAWLRTARLVVADPSYRDATVGDRGEPVSWARASATLAPIVQAADAVVVSEDTKALYYLGRADFVINRDHLFSGLPLDGEPREEFSVNPKVNVPFVSRPESIDRIARCFRSGLVVSQNWMLRSPFVVPDDTREHLLARFEPVELPPEWGITALRWTTPQPDPPEACELRRPWRPAEL